MDDRQFRAWLALIEQRAGLVFAEERRAFVNSGIRRGMGEAGCRDYGEYYRRLRRADDAEWARLVDHLTVHETRFFRHPPSFALLREGWLPGLVRDGVPRKLRIWSAGCASGEEAYSLAMLADQQLSACPGWDFEIIGSDISEAVLARARAGVYDERRLKYVDSSLASRYCRPLGGGRHRIDARLRGRVRFEAWNLERGPAPWSGIDLVYCQNLLIYFDRARRADIAARLAASLNPGGLLVLGPGELPGWRPRGLERVQWPETLAYRRLDTGLETPKERK